MAIHGKVAASYSNRWVQTLKQPVPWIWDGLIAPNAITLLSAPAKTGKTTLLSLLLDRRRAGGGLLGRAVRPGRTIVCSQEDAQVWAERQPPLDFGPQLEFHWPLHLGTGGLETWVKFIDHLLELGVDRFDLLVIDTVMHFLPGAENNAASMRRALDELRVVASLPAGVLLLHQTAVARSRSRDRGILAGFADILLDMDVPRGDPTTRRRHFQLVGRYGRVPQRFAAELNDAGTNYLPLPDGLPGTAYQPTFEVLRVILRQSPEPLTRQEILARWPESAPPLRADSLWRTLTRGCQQGVFFRTGAGNKAEAFRYGIAEAATANVQGEIQSNDLGKGQGLTRVRKA